MRVAKFVRNTHPFSFWGSNCEYKDAEVVIIPAAFDATCSNRPGCRKGPIAIIDESLETEPYDIGWDINSADRVFTLDCLRVFDDCIKMQRALSKVVKGVAEDGKIPLVLGGDHSLTPASVFAVKNALLKNFFVLVFDAHSDLRKKYRGNRFSHASCMYRIRRDGNFKIINAGVRTYSKEISKHVKENNISLFGPAELNRFFDCLSQFKNQLVYVSFDADVYDPAIMPCVGAPEPGGLNFKEVCLIFETLKNLNIKIIGADFVEFSPHDFKNNAPANLAVRTIGKIVNLIVFQNRKRSRTKKQNKRFAI